MKRGAELRILGLALALAGTACATAPPASPARTTASTGHPLRIMSFNIHHGAGNDDCTTAAPAPGAPPVADCGLNLERIADIIRDAGIDVAGLQEVDRFWGRSGMVDQPAALGAMLTMQTCYGANLVHPADAHSSAPHEYGTLILSRHPIAACDNMLLPRAGTASEQRGLLRARIRAGAIALDFYDTHLHTEEADRRLQIDAIVERLGAPAGPVVLVGDLNARPAAPYLAPLFAVLRDAWPPAGTGLGFTSPASPREPPRNRIDYLLVSRGVTVTAAATLVTPQTARASDHYPVVAGIALSAGRR